MNVEDFIAEHSDLGVRHYNMFYVLYENASEFVALCTKHDLGLLGAEGFRISPDGVLPYLEWIADFSDLVSECHDWQDFRDRCNSEMSKFVKKVPTPPITHIQFTIFNRVEWLKARDEP